MTCYALRLGLIGLVLSIAGCEPKTSAPPPPPAAPPPPVVTAPPPPPPGEPQSPDLIDPPKERAELPPGPIRPQRPPAPMTPPFGGEGVLLDQYEFGGIGGFGDRIRVVGEEATLFHWTDTVATGRLTPEEIQALAALVAAQAPINWQSDDGPVPDGMESGSFLAGRGTAKDEGKAGQFGARLILRLRATVPPR